jgi:hypothetical protein
MPTFPQPPSRAEKAYNALLAAHRLLQMRADTEDDLPAWFLLTAAGPVRIQTIGTYREFVQFTTPEEHIVLIAPEAVAVTMQKLAPESSEPRFPIGFRGSGEESDQSGDSGS